MNKLKVLYVSSELDPFLKISHIADMVCKLPQAMQIKGMEIRILMPKFGIINERKNRLHEVVRLSGMQIPMGDEQKPLVIKVASVPNARLQVYFIDNEDYFRRKSVFFDKEDKFHSDNDERTIFFCKSVIETIRKLGWAPNIIHCSDWMTSLVSLYAKTVYRNDPVFSQAKFVFTVSDKATPFQFGDNLFDKIKVMDMEDEALEALSSKDYQGFVRLGATYADAVTGIADEKVLNKLLNGQAISTIAHDYNNDTDNDHANEAYYELYNNLLS